jgi:hypothetical protein
LLEKTPEHGRSKMKLEIKVMKKTPDITTKCCFSCEEEGHLSRNCQGNEKGSPPLKWNMKEMK